MQNTILYFHGLNSDTTSRKFLNIKNHFSEFFDVYCIEWKNDTDIPALIHLIDEEYKYKENLVVIGDSTGGNFAYQLKERRKTNGKKTVLALLNPLLDFEQRKSTEYNFPESIEKYLCKITSPKDAFLLLSKNDEIIDHSFLSGKTFLNTKILWVDDTHRLPKFLEFVRELERYIFSKIV